MVWLMFLKSSHSSSTLLTVHWCFWCLRVETAVAVNHEATYACCEPCLVTPCPLFTVNYLVASAHTKWRFLECAVDQNIVNPSFAQTWALICVPYYVFFWPLLRIVTCTCTTWEQRQCIVYPRIHIVCTIKTDKDLLQCTNKSNLYDVLHKRAWYSHCSSRLEHEKKRRKDAGQTHHASIATECTVEYVRVR
jgi:hypothetical protein